MLPNPRRAAIVGPEDIGMRGQTCVVAEIICLAPVPRIAASFLKSCANSVVLNLCGARYEDVGGLGLGVVVS